VCVCVCVVSCVCVWLCDVRECGFVVILIFCITHIICVFFAIVLGMMKFAFRILLYLPADKGRIIIVASASPIVTGNYYS
jgi:hypothetical protein